MEFKDYYKIMGVAPEATADEIKRQYRILARKYHPDVSKEKDAEARFKEVGEAYEVLKDKEKRAAYDNLYRGGWKGGQRFERPQDWQFEEAQMGGAGGADFSDFFSSLFGQMGGGARGGFRQQAGRSFRTRGEDLHYSIEITLQEAYAGGTRALQLRIPEMSGAGHWEEKTKTLNVKIPAGITEGQQIRLAGQGAPGQGGGPNGDLFLEVHIQADPRFQLDGRDVTLALRVTPWEAALGATLNVPTLGGTIALKIPADSQTGAKLRLKARGLPGNPPGDQFVLLQVIIPKADTPEAKKLYEEMAAKLNFNPRGL